MRKTTYRLVLLAFFGSSPRAKQGSTLGVFVAMKKRTKTNYNSKEKLKKCPCGIAAMAKSKRDNNKI